MANPDVEACCLMGSGHSSPFAIVLLAPEARRRCTSPEAWKTLEQSLRSRLEEVNTQLDPHERVQFIAIADGPWTVSNGFMTPTLKLKRTALENRYQALVDNWERTNCPVVWESAPVPVRS